MRLSKGLLKKPGLYLVTDNVVLKGRDLIEILSCSLKAGLDMVQFRDKEASDMDFFEEAGRIKKLLKGKALFIINDRVHIALALDADGVHLGKEDMPAPLARKILGKKKIIGVSSSSLEEAVSAEKQPVDYIAIGAVFKTAVKPCYKTVGLDKLKLIAGKIKKPIVAIGGINETNIQKVAAAGIKRAAVVRAVLEAGNPYSSTINLLNGIR